MLEGITMTEERRPLEGAEAVDWPRFLAMVDHLMVAKRLPTDAALGRAIGASHAIIYNWRKEKGQPDQASLKKLAAFAHEVPRLPELEETWRWMEVCGYSVAPDGGALSDEDRDLLSISHALRPEKRGGLVDIASAYWRSQSDDGASNSC